MTTSELKIIAPGHVSVSRSVRQDGPNGEKYTSENVLAPLDSSTYPGTKVDEMEITVQVNDDASFDEPLDGVEIRLSHHHTESGQDGVSYNVGLQSYLSWEEAAVLHANLGFLLNQARTILMTENASPAQRADAR
jgi:hypothetical protein